MSTRQKSTETASIASELRRDRLTLANSTITFESGPVGAIARVDHTNGTREYAGPLDDATIAALREVGE